jgi:hypothetical protein
MTPFPRTQFLALVASILSVPPLYVTWKGTPEPAYMKPAPAFRWASARIGTSKRTTIGNDDIRLSDDGDGTFTASTVGRRQIILSVDLFTWDSTIEDDAVDLLDFLMSELSNPDNLDTLNAMGLVNENYDSIIPLPTTINSRYVSAAHVDLTVALAFRNTAKFPGGEQWVGEVQVSGTVTDAGGGATPPQTNDVIRR